MTGSPAYVEAAVDAAYASGLMEHARDPQGRSEGRLAVKQMVEAVLAAAAAARTLEGAGGPVPLEVVIARLDACAAGRREYAWSASTKPAPMRDMSTREYLEQEGAAWQAAADVARGDLSPLYGALPSWRWTDEMEARLFKRPWPPTPDADPHHPGAPQ